MGEEGDEVNALDEMIRELDTRFDPKTIEIFFAEDARARASVSSRTLVTQKFAQSQAFNGMLERYVKAALDGAPLDSVIYAGCMAGIRFGYWLAKQKEATQ
jgi:uncharacterized protein YajQ (UPF0234 family)